MKAWTKWFSYRHWSRKKGAEQISVLFGGLTAGQLYALVEPGFFSSKLADCPLKKHIEVLETEFVGVPTLVLYHSILIVLIRREADTKTHFAEFERLWADYEADLLKYLNLRWLVSAADTLIDHHKDPAVRALMLSSVMSVNMLKVYETVRAVQMQIFDQVLLRLKGEEKFILFDGLTSFKVGTDDTLFNQKKRMMILCSKIAYGSIHLEIYSRLHSLNDKSLLNVLLSLHSNKRTEW